MKQPIVYDKAKYHYEGRFPSNLPKKQAFVHTGLFVAWLAHNNLLTGDITASFREEIASLRKREMSPAGLYELLDGVLSDDMLNEVGRAFTEAYFDFETGQYLNDYEEVLCPGLRGFFYVADTWENYDRIAARIDSRFQGWQATREKL